MPLSFHRNASAFSRACGGAIAVEFALLALPFLALLVFIGDISTNYFIFAQIDNGAQTAVNRLRAGEIAATSYTPTTFRDQILCPRMPVLACARLVVNLSVRPGGATLSPGNVAGASWCPGGPQDALILQVAYPIPFLTRIWAGSAADSTPYYVSSYGLRNSPTASAGGC